MKIKNEKEALQAFCASNDDFRPVLNHPYVNEERNEVWASDAHMLLMVDLKLVRRKYKPSDFGKSLTIPEKNSDTIVTLKDIEAAFKRFKLIPEMVDEEGDECECPACGGDGEVEWEFTDDDGNTYYMDAECPVCEGSGEAVEHHKVPTGKMLSPKDAMFVIDDVRFPAYYMMKAVEGLHLLGCKELRHVVTSKDSANLFDVQDGIRLLFMPCVGDGVTRKVKTTASQGV